MSLVPTLSASTISARSSKPPVHDADPLPEGLERRARRRHRDGVPVDAEEPEVGTGVEEEPGMAPAADGGVDDQSRRNGDEELAPPPGP